MKILAGEWGGRRIDQPASSKVRPLSDKVRAAIFDVYGDVTGKVVLDVYAGSGAAGLEALSRGAAMVDALEADPRVAQVISRNAHALGADWGYVLTVLKVETWLGLPANQSTEHHSLARYDLIIVDPPYMRLELEIIERLAAFLVMGGIMVLSRSSKHQVGAVAGLETVTEKIYGDTALTFYRKMLS